LEREIILLHFFKSAVDLKEKYCQCIFVKPTPEMREVYKTIGGTPHLDGQYTVFGEVVSGLNVVDTIQQVTTDTNDRPVEDVRIIRAYLR